MSGLAMPETDIDTGLLQELDFEPGPPTCDYTDCEEEATHMLVCGVCYVGREFMCGEHTVVTRIAQLQAPTELIVFNKTCNHSPELGNCQIAPLAA